MKGVSSCNITIMHGESQIIGGHKVSCKFEEEEEEEEEEEGHAFVSLDQQADR